MRHKNRQRKATERERQIRKMKRRVTVPAVEEGDSPVDDEGAQNEEIDNQHCKPGREEFKNNGTK